MFRIRNVEELLRDGETIIELVKKGDKRFRLLLSPGDKKILSSIREKVRIVCEDRKPIEWLFRARHKKKKQIHFELLQQHLNEILPFTEGVGACAFGAKKYALALFGKYLRTHSFPATRVTDCMVGERVCAEDVAAVVGHKNSITIKRYNRADRNYEWVLAQMDKVREINSEELVKLANLDVVQEHVDLKLLALHRRCFAPTCPYLPLLAPTEHGTARHGMRLWRQEYNQEFDM